MVVVVVVEMKVVSRRWDELTTVNCGEEDKAESVVPTRKLRQRCPGCRINSIGRGGGGGGAVVGLPAFMIRVAIFPPTSASRQKSSQDISVRLRACRSYREGGREFEWKGKRKVQIRPRATHVFDDVEKTEYLKTRCHCSKIGDNVNTDCISHKTAPFVSDMIVMTDTVCACLDCD